jgi:mRNA interferase MazF
VSAEPEPRRGEVWDADLDPAVGHEQDKIRPVLIVSHDRFNALRNRLCIGVAITGTIRPIPSHVPVRPPEGGLDRPSVIQCEQIRVLAYERLHRRRGQVNRATMAAVEARLRQLLAL